MLMSIQLRLGIYFPQFHPRMPPDLDVRRITMAETSNTIAITGAGGQYAGLVINGLLDKGVPPSSLILLTRNPDKLAGYASKGLAIRKGSFDDAVADLAAAEAGVSHIVYTSIVSAHLETPTALVGREHRATGTVASQPPDPPPPKRSERQLRE